MSANAIISAVNHRRIRRARAWLESRPAAEEVLIVGATLDAANELTRGVAKEKAAAFGWHRLTLSQLAATIAAPALATRGLIPLSRIGTEAIVARLVHRLNEEGRLSRYHRVAATPGFPRAVAGVITELRLARLPLDAIAGAVPDLVPLIGMYEAELKEAGLTDWPGVLALATEAASAASTNPLRLVGLPMLLLDVPIGSEAELVFVRALAAAATEVLATVPAADQPTLGRLRDRLRIQIENLDEVPLGDEGSASATTTSALGNLQRRLFSEQAGPIEGKPDDTVEVFSAPGEGRECIEIARRVLSLARRGVPFERIAVLMRSPEEYRAYLEEAFNRAGIPVHYARGAVRPDPAGRAFCALLKCAAEGLSAQRFAEYLSLGQVPDAVPGGTPPDAAPGGDRWIAPDSEFVPQFSTEDVGEQPRPVPPAADSNDGVPVRDGQLRAPRRWERLLVEAAVIGGRDRWRRRIDGLASDLRLRLAEVAEEDETQAATLSRTLEDLAAFAGYAIPLIDALDSLPASANWGGWLDQFGALATRALKQPDRVLAVLAELAPMGPVGPVALNEVLLVLERLLLEVAVPPPSQRYGKVLAAPIDAARGLSFEAVFVPGLAEKMFPRKIVEEPILLDAAREQIGEGLATNQTRLERERLAMAVAAGGAERRICFSYPRLDLDQARPRVPSFYTLEAVRAAEGPLPDFADLARRAETATTARLGWPAPPDPADAIDAAEHDLAVLDRLQRGSLIHDVQFDLFARLRKDRLLPVRPSNLARAQQRLDAIIAEVAAHYRDDLAPAIDRVWEDGVAAIRADLREWLRRASEDDSGYVPWYFELSFGLEHRPERRQADPQSVPGAADLDCGIQLRGSIDVVERHPSGTARVTDHKTGKADAKPTQLIDGGKLLQPLLYALAAEKLFTGQAKISSGRLYFCTAAGGFTEQVVLLDDNARAAAVQIAEAVGDAVAHPFLPAAPDKRQCDLCEFRVVCGPYEERRAARKPQGNLEPLLALRAMP